MKKLLSLCLCLFIAAVGVLPCFADEIVQQPVIKNISFSELQKDEIKYFLLQPVYSLVTFFGNIYMDIEQD